jgi:hypothetical protein
VKIATVHPALLASALVMALAAPVRAETTWSYNWLIDDTVLETQTGGVALAATPPGLSNLTHATTPVAVVSLFGSLKPGLQESLSDGQLDLRLQLKNETTGDATELNFGGTLSGTFSAAAVDLKASFDPAQEVNLGGTLFTVKLTSFVPPGPIGSGTLGSLAATVDLSTPPVTAPPPVAQAPEPAALLLAALGAPALLAARRRRC